MKRRMPFSRASRPAKAEPDTFSQSSSDEEPGSGPSFVALDRSREFWMVIGYAVVFGLVLAFAGLAFLGLLKGGTKLWFTLPKNPDWFSGSLWWVAVTAAAGVLVGVLRRVLRLPAKLPGTMKELRDERVEPSTVLKAIAVSLVSLVGGASLGPEDALGKIGGGLGTWVSERRNLGNNTSATNALSGMSGAYAVCCHLRSWRRASWSRSHAQSARALLMPWSRLSGGPVREDADDVGAPADLLVEALLRVVAPDLAPDLAGEGGEGEDVVAGVVEVGGGPGELGLQRLHDVAVLGMHGGSVGLLEDGAHQG